MKTLQRVFQVLSLALGAAALVAFFLPGFVKIDLSEIADGFGRGVYNLLGAELAFGSQLKDSAGTSIRLAQSTYFLFAFLIALLGTLFSGLAIKFKGSAYAAPAFYLVGGIVFTVFTVYHGTRFVDFRQLPADARYLTSYGWPFFLAFGAIVAGLVVSILSLLVTDRVMVEASHGAKKPIFTRLGQFLREYKSEIKKIVWPGPREVVRNTLIVLAMCVAIGIFIWVADFLFGQGIIKLFEGM